jgi:nucleotide-binding universal stress UspA family protein
MYKMPNIEAPIDTGYKYTGFLAEGRSPLNTTSRSSLKPSEHNRFPIKLERILVPTDLTSESERAIEYGFVLAQRFGAHLTLLYVYKESYAVEYMRGPHACDEVLTERMYFKNALESTAEKVKKNYADCDFEFRDGVPCEEIVKTAKERGMDLIVISTHHYNWLTRLAYGCDAEQILRHAPCPILLLHNDERADARITEKLGISNT